MSALLGNGTLANPNTAYYSGGGGASVSTFITASVSTLSVSSITAQGGGTIYMPTEVSISSLAGPNAGGTLVQNGLEFVDGAQILFDAASSASAMINFSGNDGIITGVSSINGAAYPPAGGAGAAISTIITGGLTVGSAAVNLVPTGPTLSTGKYYLFTATFDSPTNNVIGAPTAGDHAGFVLPDTTIPYTLDLTELAAQKAKGQPLGFSFAAPFVAGAGAFQLTAYCNAAATASTFVGASSPGWIIPLN